ncbi:MAG: hypothetical protein H7338_17930 [Candidatus Sericytochromatia bacterium]|nr:hypothetical protein [Candidatus Sericytochromatia bacterium]
MAEVPGSSVASFAKSPATNRFSMLQRRHLLLKLLTITLISSCLPIPAGTTVEPPTPGPPADPAVPASSPDGPWSRYAAPASGMYIGWFGKPNSVNGGGFAEIFSGGSNSDTNTANRPAMINATLDWVHARFGRQMGLIHMYEDAGDRADFPLTVASELARRRQLLMVSLSFGKTTAAELADGAGDLQWRNWARGAKAWGRPVILRWGWEAPVQPWARDAAAYKAAWQRMWRIIKTDVGAGNVQLAFTPVYFATGWGTYQDYFPGDAYVDWVGVDDFQPPGKGFEDSFEPAYDWFAHHAPGKPFMVAEWGMKYATDNGVTTYEMPDPDWYARTLDAARTHGNIKAYVLYDNDQEIRSALSPTWAGMATLKRKLLDVFYLPQPTERL